jgi:hypothetical protein
MTRRLWNRRTEAKFARVAQRPDFVFRTSRLSYSIRIGWTYLPSGSWPLDRAVVGGGIVFYVLRDTRSRYWYWCYRELAVLAVLATYYW